MTPQEAFEKLYDDLMKVHCSKFHFRNGMSENSYKYDNICIYESGSIHVQYICWSTNYLSKEKVKELYKKISDEIHVENTNRRAREQRQKEAKLVEFVQNFKVE